MESVVLQNPQSWNRYAYTINNPLRYVDPNGEVWVESGDSSNPYGWVDECQKKQTCYQSVAAVVQGRLRVYGSQNAKDVANYAPNVAGNIDLRALAAHPDAFFGVKPGANGFVSLGNAAGFFNTAEQYPSCGRATVSCWLRTPVEQMAPTTRRTKRTDRAVLSISGISDPTANCFRGRRRQTERMLGESAL